jgi:hypothetical protein
MLEGIAYDVANDAKAIGKFRDDRTSFERDGFVLLL